MKHLIIVHGWDGHPEEGWFPWLKQKAEVDGFTVSVPQLPVPEEPRIERWVPVITELISNCSNKDVYLVGHSMGCQTITRALERLQNTNSVKGVIYVAGFFTKLTGLDEFADEPEEQKIVDDVGEEWLTTPLDFTKSNSIKSVALFSDNDPYVPLINTEVFRDELHSEVLIIPQMKHFSGSSGTVELPLVYEKLLDLTK